MIETLPAHHPKSPSREMEYSDVEVVGLRLLVSKNGRKFFYLRYRYNSRKRVIRIGEFPATSLQDARQRANEFKNMLSQGIDPLSERDKVTGGMTFQVFGEQGLRQCAPVFAVHGVATQRQSLFCTRLTTDMGSLCFSCLSENESSRPFPHSPHEFRKISNSEFKTPISPTINKTCGNSPPFSCHPSP
ncbi:Arm DNA-binding domain-containing protein [Desulfococcus sp.]|uniref:Arm DNA-binding domain-containing protein n=1 Tax=Desulfococcus sp. TaxID=2025834 RepID=UPI0035943625